MDGIEFGQVERRQPEVRLRPDRDQKYSTVACGQVDPQQLKIFADLDVMRDMEGHARTNTQVELGGVLLGGKYIDQQGCPFVIVSEALRAEHYEATRGSFKFTHETWAQITRDRQKLSGDLQLVGWYHTHPDWGVFLSSMDTFICDNFFNDDLDIDLVIDPCRGDRGWFFWDNREDLRKKQRLNAFYLYTNRFRRTELLHFAKALSEVDATFFDPRYENSFGEPVMQPVVNIHDPKSPVISLAVMGMLTVQILVLGILGWKVLTQTSAEKPDRSGQEALVYQEVIEEVIANSPENQSLIISKYGDLVRMNRRLETDKWALKEVAEKLRKENEGLVKQRDAYARDNTKLEGEIDELKGLQEFKDQGGGESSPEPGGWFWRIAIGGVGLGFGLLAGGLLGRRFAFEEFDAYDKEAQSEEISQNAKTNQTDSLAP